MFAYVSNRIPEISDELYKIDDAMNRFRMGKWSLKFGMLGVEKEL
jgi:hypothetical protein